MLREKSSASAIEHNLTRPVHAGQGRRVRPGGVVRRQEDRVLDEVPDDATRRRSTALPACTGHAGTSGSTTPPARRLDRRRLPPHHRARPTATTSIRPTCRPAAASCSRRTGRPSRRSTQATRRSLPRARRVRARARPQPAHDGQGRRRDHADLVQPEPRAQPGGAAERRHHVLALGARRPRATASRSSAPSPTAPTCSCSTARRARATASCIRATWTRAGKYAGFVSSSLMSLSGTQEGGSLMFIDAANYSENNTPANSTVLGRAAARPESDRQAAQPGPRPVDVRPHHHALPALGRHQPRAARLPAVRGDARRRRRPLRQPDRRRDRDASSDENADARRSAPTRSVQDNVPPSYAIYMYDPAPQTWLIVAAPPPGFMHTDPVALQPRTEPNATEPTSVDAALAAQRHGADRGAQRLRHRRPATAWARTMLAAVDLPAGCTRRHRQADAARRDATRAAGRRPGADEGPGRRRPTAARRRASCAPCAPSRRRRTRMGGMREAIGETEFEHAADPRLRADRARRLVQADRAGRHAARAARSSTPRAAALQTHLNWIQVRPGERRTCDGCHSPRRGARDQLRHRRQRRCRRRSRPTLGGAHQSGETMAALRTRLDPSALDLQSDLRLHRHLGRHDEAGVVARAAINVTLHRQRQPGRRPGHARRRATASSTTRSTSQPTVDRAAPAAPTPAPTATPTRPSSTCAPTISGTGRITSVRGAAARRPGDRPGHRPAADAHRGRRADDRARPGAGRQRCRRRASGMARSSRLAEILFGETLQGRRRRAHRASESAVDRRRTTRRCSTPPSSASSPSGWTSAASTINDPFDAASVRAVATLSQATFEAQVLPGAAGKLCAGCHQAGGSTGRRRAGTSFRGNRFVLTGSPEGDYNVTLSMISDTCNAASNYLLSAAVDRAASAPARPTQTTAGAADGQRRLQRDRELDHRPDVRHPDSALARSPPSRAAAAARRPAGGGSNPLGNPPAVENRARQRRPEALLRLLPEAASTRSSWRSCRSTRAASARPTPAPARAATTTPTAPAARFASCRRRRRSTSPTRPTRPT